MEKMNLDSPKLTENDKIVLKKILESKKMPDSDIAKSMNLSPQAIFKIRNKLEHIGIIQGYMPILDFKKIGINIIVILIVRLKPKVWANFTDSQIANNISDAPYVLDAYRVSDEYASHILVLAFKDNDQKEKYISDIQVKFAEEIRIRATYTFSTDKIITHNSLNILHEILNKKDYCPSNLFKK